MRPSEPRVRGPLDLTLDEKNIMNDSPVSKTPYQRMSVSTLKTFIFILFPLAKLG